MSKTFPPKTIAVLKSGGWYVESTRAHRHFDTAQGKIRADIYSDCRWRVTLAGGLIDGNKETHPAYAAMAANECAWQWRDRVAKGEA